MRNSGAGYPEAGLPISLVWLPEKTAPSVNFFSQAVSTPKAFIIPVERKYAT
jgi:hypothetical protein